MYDLNSVITIANAGVFTKKPIISKAKSKDPIETDTPLLTKTPVIFIGHTAIDSENPTTPGSLDIYNQAGEDLIQSFDFHLNCMEPDLQLLWRELHKAMIGKNVQPLEEQFSGFTYKQGGMLGIDNGRIWWLDRWQIAFPTLNIF